MAGRVLNKKKENKVITISTIFHYDTLQLFRSEMYDTLLFKHNLKSSTPKEVEFKDYDGDIKCFILQKNNSVYLLDKRYFKQLPIRIKESKELVTKQGDVVQVITKFDSFAIKASKEMTFREMVDIIDISHTNNDLYTLWKIVAYASRISRINIRVCSPSEWGKSSIFHVLDMVFYKSPVVTQVRSVPAFALNVSPDGLIVLDEMGNIPGEIKDKILSCLLQCGDMKTKLTLGSAGSHSHGTKPLYDIHNFSCVCLYNDLSQYKDPEKFFDRMWSNNRAVTSRFLPLRLKGGVLDMTQFRGKAPKLTQEVKNKYYAMMKSLEWYTEHWDTESDQEYVMQMCGNNCPQIKGIRHPDSLFKIGSFIYLYTQGNESEFVKYLKLLGKSYDEYLDMTLDKNYLIQGEEYIE